MLRRASISTCLLVGCSADGPRAATDARATDEGVVAVTVDDAEASAPSSRGAAPASLRCDGTPLPDCDGPLTGSTCDLPCLGPANDPAYACGLELRCHSDGSVYGLAARNAVLYLGAPDDPLEAMKAELEEWIVAHPADLALEPGLDHDDLELHVIDGARSTAGKLTIVRFAQTYDGLPVLAPDGIVTVVYGPQGAVSVSGAIVDRRIDYDHRAHQVHQERAEIAMLRYASAYLGIASDELELVHVARVAMPMARTIAWAGFVRQAGGAMRARVIVDADPVLAGPLPALLSLRELGAAGLADTQPIAVRTVDPTGEPQSLAYHTETTLTTGAPLLGSVYDATGEIQLATEQVVVLDLHGKRHKDLVAQATRVLDPAGEFLEDSGADLAAQVAYHLFQSWYDFIDGHMTEPATGAKRWDSANAVYSDGMAPSDAPPGTYVPRMLASVNASGKDCPVQGTACAGVIGYEPMSDEAAAFPELLHVPAGATSPEAIGHVFLPGDGVEPVTFAHEMGHVVDLFAGAGITDDLAPDCGNGCPLECIEGTSDEAPPLTESIAQLFALLFLRQSFADLAFDDCSIVDLVAVNGDKAWTPGTCIPPDEDISLFQREGSCTKPAPYCDRPEDPGTELQCCFDDEDLADCTVPLSDTCAVGAEGPTGGLGVGMARAVPTGLCADTPGYQTNSLYQAFWQLLNGQRCEPTPPFTCEPFEWVPGMSPLDATTAAFLYALRTSPLTYDQLFEEMARYVACNYGPAAYEAFNAVVCGHGIRDCAMSPPMVCTHCGNGVREGAETCDGTDWLTPRCEDSPEFSGGTLTCDQATCTLDHSQCMVSGLDDTAGTAGDPDDASSSSTGLGWPDTETTGAGEAPRDDDGCRCRAVAARDGRMLTLVSLLLVAAGCRRRPVS